ncbi:MAG: hypothetical protein JNG89_04100 [Planctomycetaceae bacterium]|nr:hypothetical protein [Planctomycetaceae bacterium]
MADVKETEDQLIQRAQQALSRCNWEIGECAAMWTKRFARGRTDADFGGLIGLSGDQVYQRRRVWETFNDIHERYGELKWSHFYASLNWDDAAECLQWAQDMSATVAEMKAWRRAQHGEDLSTPSDDLPAALSSLELLPVGAGLVRDPETGERDYGERRRSDGDRETDAPVVAGAPRMSDGPDDYAPFGATARGPVSSGSERTPPDAETVVRRLAANLERCNAALTPEVLEACAAAPEEVQSRLKNAVKEVTRKLRSVLE